MTETEQSLIFEEGGAAFRLKKTPSDCQFDCKEQPLAHHQWWQGYCAARDDVDKSVLFFPIKLGNIEGQYFTQWRFEELLYLFRQLLEKRLEMSNVQLYYDAHSDFHCLEFLSHGHQVVVRFYKVFGTTIKGVDQWCGGPRYEVHNFALALKKKLVNNDIRT